MAFCSACGAEVEGAFCRVCGARLPMPPLATEHGDEGQTSLDLPGDEFFSVIFPASPEKQSRWTVLVRPALAFPLLIAEWWFSLGLIVVLPWTWVATLVLGRVPNGARRYLTKCHRLRASNSAYLQFVTGTWPGVLWNARATSDVRVSSGPVRHRRVAVFFKLLLAMPAALAVTALSIVGIFVAVLQWVLGIVAGRQPVLLHQWRVVTLRFAVRASAFALLLTPLQPFRGLTGEPAELASRPGAVATSGMLRILVIAALVMGLPLNVLVTNRLSSVARNSVIKLVLSQTRTLVDTKIVEVEQLPSTCAPQPVNSCGETNTTVGSLLTASTSAQNIFSNVQSLDPKPSYLLLVIDAEGALLAVDIEARAITPIGVHSEAATLAHIDALRHAKFAFDRAVRQLIATL